jgi:hypothetical protein
MYVSDVSLALLVHCGFRFGRSQAAQAVPFKTPSAQLMAWQRNAGQTSTRSPISLEPRLRLIESPAIVE